MASSISRLLETISRDHFPYPAATPEEIEEFEGRMGWQLDPDLRSFYLHCNGAELFRRPTGTSYRILPLSQIVRARTAIRGEDNDRWGPASMYAICDMQDGNYVVVDTDHRQTDRYVLIDGDHETWPDFAYCEKIANSFSEFLDNALRSRGRSYWLTPAADR